MKCKLADFIVALAVSPLMFASFSADPARVMKEAKLSPEEQSVLLGGNTDQISQYIAKDLGLAAGFCYVMVEVITPTSLETVVDV